MKALGLLLMGGLIVGGGYWWSSQPAETLSFENPRSLELEPISEMMSETFPAESTKVSEEISPTVSVATPLGETPPPAPQSIQPAPLAILERLVRFGFRTPPTSRSIDTIVLHSSYNKDGSNVYDVESLLRQFEALGAAPHYLIDREGKIIQLVRESHIAYHVGQSKLPDGRINGNDVSIGIELMGTEESGFTEKQYISLSQLAADIKTRWSIRNMVAHSDISTAPERKTDPWKFDWKKVR